MKGLTRATTAINSGHPEESPMATCCLGALTSSSTIATSLMTLFAASCASCLAAVVLTEVDEPVSRRRRSRSNLEEKKRKRVQIRGLDAIAKTGDDAPRGHHVKSIRRKLAPRVVLWQETGGVSHGGLQTGWTFYHSCLCVTKL